MLYMNEFDIAHAERIADNRGWRVTQQATQILDRLRDWADRNSDGWAYWPAPGRAARLLQEAIQEQERKSRDHSREQSDMTYNERDAALRPIKAFLTRQKVPAETREWIVDPEASAKRSADIAAAAAASRTEALHEEARQYARRAVEDADLGYSSVLDLVTDAYFAGATR